MDKFIKYNLVLMDYNYLITSLVFIKDVKVS